MSENCSLRIEIRNDGPIELNALSKSLNGWASQYDSFCKRKGINKKDSALLVQEVKRGSIIVELVSASAPFLLPELNNIIQFGLYIKDAISFFMNEKDKPPYNYTKKDCADIESIVNPTASDTSRAELHIHTIGNNNNVGPIIINNTAANAIQAIAEKKKKEVSTDDFDSTHESVAFTYSRADTSSCSDTPTDRGVVEKISTKAVKVAYADEDIKRKMLCIEDNPFGYVYLFDAKVVNHNGKPSFYQSTLQP